MFAFAKNKIISSSQKIFSNGIINRSMLNHTKEKSSFVNALSTNSRFSSTLTKPNTFMSKSSKMGSLF